MRTLRATLALWAVTLLSAVVTAQGVEVNEYLTVKGDIRNRFETIDQDGKDARNRFRLRARIGLEAQAFEDLDLHFRLETNQGDPVSGNETLGRGFDGKDSGLGRAYMDWHPGMVEGLNVYLGKMAQPWIRVKGLLWDGDLNPEGYAMNYGRAIGAADLFLHGGVFQLVERKSDDETFLFSAQAAAKVKPTETAYLQGGAGLFAYSNLEGQTVLINSDESFGNSALAVVDALGADTGEFVYANDFTEVELFFIGGWKGRLPGKVYGDYVVNTDADTDDTGYLFGLTLGKAGKPGSWALDYNYRDLEANAVVGGLTDSDSGGGGTDVKGHRAQAKYQLAKNWQFSLTWFFNQVDSGNTDYSRGQVDLIAKF